MGLSPCPARFRIRSLRGEVWVSGSQHAGQTLGPFSGVSNYLRLNRLSKIASDDLCLTKLPEAKKPPPFFASSPFLHSKNVQP